MLSIRRFVAKLFLCAVIIAVAQLFTGISSAQSTYGSFVGTVTDPSKSVIAGCTVTVKNLGTSAARTATTDSLGAYTVVNLEPGTYEITMETEGFQKATFTNLQLLSRQTIRVDGALALRTQAQTIEVSTNAQAPISTEVSTIAETKLGRELTDLPVALASRASGSTSAFSTLTTQPGVVIDNGNGISVAGSKPSQLSVTIDGISTMSPRSTAPIAELFPSFDGIAEIRVSEINNTAEFGGISDITTISKGGGNIYHGGVFENHQNSAFAARNTFSATVPKLIMNDFGGFIGGPLSIPHLYNGKDRTFFFGTFESLRLPRQVVLQESVPSIALRGGDLSAYLPKVVRDLSGVPFSNNQIPSTSIAPFSSAVLKYLYPLPNTGAAGAISNNYVQNFPAPISSNQGDVRVDQIISSKQALFVRLTIKDRSVLNSPCGGCSALVGPTSVPEKDWSFTGAYNYIITPHMVNELRAGWTGSNSETALSTPAQDQADKLGLTPYITQPLAGVSTTPNVKISGFQGTGGAYSNLNHTQTAQLLDNLTWTTGKHSVKFGGDYRYLTALFTDAFGFDFLGVYTFNNSVTSAIGNAYASFLLGIPDNDTIATTIQPDTQGYGSSFATYIQDDWKVTPRFTINYGLRWEYHPMFRDHLDNTANFLTDYSTVVNGVTTRGAVVVPDKGLAVVNPAFAQSILPTPIFTATQAKIPQGLRYASKTGFAPRIGFAWRVTDDGKTVIRGGYGKYIEAELGQLTSGAWAVQSSDVAQFTNTIANGKAQLTFPYPFPSNLAQPGTQAFRFAYGLNYQDPYVQQWNLTVERSLGFQTGLRVSYDGSHGSNLGIVNDLTQVPANTIGYAKAKLNGPYPVWAGIAHNDNGGISNYHSLTAALTKRMSRGLQFNISYNFAKNLSDNAGFNPSGFTGSNGGQTSDLYNPYLDYGNVAFTRRHRFLATYLYETRWHVRNKILDQVVSGWEVAGVLLFQTGPFLTVLAPGADPSGTNFVNSNNNSTGAVRADTVPGVDWVPAVQDVRHWVNPAAFATPPNNIGRFSDSSVGSVVGPGTQAVSMSLYRSFKYKERVALRIGASASNLFNHPNYGSPNLTLGTAPFGTISSLAANEGVGPRGIQLGGRLTF